ncbi:metal-dependent transcriptional regulator [Ruminococcaceae bacterium OttesenSCG-928-I18]|nr:metal-dependent transcriptional regulator [Ruminococcaceae bacterium OttesenSCG-928-I18]
MATLRKSAEDYLETILVLKREKGVVHSVDIAHYMEYSKPSVSRAVNNLRRDGYLEMARNGELTLTASGLEKAEQILERHQVLTTMLTALGVPKEVAAEDACEVEHALSEISFQCIRDHYTNQIQPKVARKGDEDEKKKEDKKKKKKKKKG